MARDLMVGVVGGRAVLDTVSASQSCAADSTSVSSTALRSKVERLMILRTSAVAVCCCSDCLSSFNSRVFSIAITAWVGEILHQFNLFIGEGANFLAVDANGTD